MKRAALYVRVSTQEQAKSGLSVDSQIAALKEYAEKEGYQIVGIYNDAGVSARKKYKSRPELLRLMGDCQRGEVDLILFTKLDRWFRSVADYYEVQSILDSCKVPWRAIWEDYETETSAGIFKVNIMLSVAQAESDRTSERIKAVNEYRRSKGEYPASKVPLGYVVKKGKIYYDEDTRPAVAAFFSAYLNTLSYNAALDAAAEYGLKINKFKARTMLRSEIYTGHLEYMTFPAYISNDEFKFIQSRKKTCRQPKDKRQYIFSGLLVCGTCGHRLTGTSVKRQRSDGSTYEHLYYRCRSGVERLAECSGNLVNESKLEAYLISVFAEELDKYTLELKANPVSRKNADTEKKRAALGNKLERLKNLYEEGDMELEEYKKKRDRIKSDLSELRIEPVKLPPALPADWKEIYIELDRLHRRAFWLNTVDRIVISRGADPHIIF